MRWSTACPDWEDRILSGRSLVPCAPLFPEEAASALAIFKSLRIVDAVGSPTMGEACEPWVFDFVAAVFGGYDAEEGVRLINEFFLLISKKNGKSVIAAGIMVTALLRNWRRDADFLILAPTIEVARNSADPAMSMVLADPELMALLKPIPHERTIKHRTTGAKLRIIAADKDVVAGKKATAVLIDELWLFGPRARAENMLREATGGLASRPEGFVISLSTQSDDPPEGVFKAALKRFRQIRDGELSAPKAMGILYEFPRRMVEDGSYRDPSNWHITNPNLGVSVRPDYLRAEMAKAEENGEASVRNFCAKHLNVEIGISLGSDHWAGADFWECRSCPALTLGEIIRRSDVVVVGIDGGGLDDLMAIAVLGRDKKTRAWLHWGRAWGHRIMLERRQSEAAKLKDFEAQGDFCLVESLGDDVAEIVGICRQIDDAGLLAMVGLDPVGVGAVVDALADAGIEGDKRVVGVSQGFTLTKAIWTVERKLADGSFAHCGQPLLAWAVGNAKAVSKGNAVLITKEVSGRAKIDPLMALFDAAALMAMNPEPMSTGSYLDTEPMLIL